MDRLLIGGVEHQRPATNYDVWFEFLDGGPADAIYEVREGRSVIAGKPGQLVTPRVADHLQIVMVGWVEGQGATHSAKREDYLALMDELRVVWDPAADPVELIVLPPVDGVSGPMSLTASFLRKTGPAKVGEFYRKMTVYWECVDDPPLWVPGS